MLIQRIRHPEKLGSKLSDQDSCDISFVVGFDGWVGDLLRLHAALALHETSNWELVVVDNPVNDSASAQIATLERVVHLPLAQSMGYAGARNLGLRQASGRLVVLVDTSIEPTGPLADPIDAALTQDVGAVGPYGIRSENGFDFEASPSGDVHGVEAYLLALRRSSLATVGLLDPKFKWYRNADLDFSFQVRSHGFRTLAVDLPVVRYEHRLWHSTEPDLRDQQSRKNFWRFRDHYGERANLW